MKKFFALESLFIGLAMFSMFFGAGNIIYPLSVGQYAGDKNVFAILGLIITSTILPIAGVMAMILFDGNYRAFFGRLGRFPGLILSFATIALLGPLGSTPRCIALAYTTLKGFFPFFSLASFSALSCLIILTFTLKKQHILILLGRILTPLLLFSLLLIIVLGFITAPVSHSPEATGGHMFLHGLFEGYNTMDLLAAFFFSSTIIGILKERALDKKRYLTTAAEAGLVAAFLLSAVYIGFSAISSFHASSLSGHSADTLLSGITMKIAGPYAGILICIAIALACLTTAIAIISAFTDFMQKEIFKDKVSYEIILIGSLLATFFVSTFEFTGISTFLWPVLKIFYPGLIVLTLLNIAYKLTGFKPIKTPVFATFLLALFFF